MDTLLKAEIVGTVNRAMREILEGMEEKWVSQKELSAQISFFTKGWIRYYGHLLPREMVQLRDENGVFKATGWGYPLHKIERMLMEGKFRDMMYEPVGEATGTMATKS